MVYYNKKKSLWNTVIYRINWSDSWIILSMFGNELLRLGTAQQIYVKSISYRILAREIKIGYSFVSCADKKYTIHDKWFAII